MPPEVGGVILFILVDSEGVAVTAGCCLVLYNCIVTVLSALLRVYIMIFLRVFLPFLLNYS